MINKEKGQILVLVITALGVVLFTVLFIIGGAQLYFQNAVYSVNAEKAVLLAEAGIDKALASLNATGGTYNGEAETTLGDDGSFSVEITDKNAANKIIKSTGYIPNKSNSKVKRTVTIQVSKGLGAAFVYGLQVGGGGLIMGNGSTLNGSIYSNGNVLGGNNSTVTGDIWAAGGFQSVPAAETDCSGSNCQDFIFGKIVSGENRRDLSQSFRITQSGTITKVSLKLKKAGSPSNPTVRILSDSGGRPNKNGVLATGILSANLASENYNFVDVIFGTPAPVSLGTDYWLMVSTPSLDSSNYWIWSLDLAQGYMTGVPKWSPGWQDPNPSWNSITGDLGFKAYMGGTASSVYFSNGSIVNGNVHANTIDGNMNIAKDAYYQNLASTVVVSGIKHENSEDPPPAVFPLSDSNMEDFKTAASTPLLGPVSSCASSLGPGKIEGSVTLGNSCNVKIFSPLWITGTLTAGNSTIFTLDSSFGPSSGFIIVDGKVTLGNGIDFKGSGTEGSYLMLIALNSSDAIDLGNSSVSGIMYAPNGIVKLSNGAAFGEITAFKIELGNNSVLNYQTGMAQAFFTTGPSGAFSLLKGTYQVK